MALRRLSNRVDVQSIVLQHVGDAKLGNNGDCLGNWKPLTSLIRSITGSWVLMIQYLSGDEANFIKRFGEGILSSSQRTKSS
jgi:hypothetical protein